MAFIKIPVDVIKHNNLTPVEKITLGAIIYYSYDNTKISRIGSYKLAEFIYGDKKYSATVRRTLKSLENKRYISIKSRRNLGKSYEIYIAFEDGLSAFEGTQINNPERNQQDSSLGNHSDSPRWNHDDSRGNHSDSSYNDIRFKNQDLNLNAEIVNRNQDDSTYIEPADVAADRSMPDGGQAAESSAKEVSVAGIRTEIEDFCIFSAFFESFPTLKPWINISKVGNSIEIQPIGYLGEKYLGEIKDRAAGWISMRDMKPVFVPANQKLNGTLFKGAI